MGVRSHRRKAENPKKLKPEPELHRLHKLFSKIDRERRDRPQTEAPQAPRLPDPEPALIKPLP